jgi:dipeptidyl aminopeptidase/acylaminoacyl peptidase
MYSRKLNIIWPLISVFTLLSGIHSSVVSAQQAKKPFTVADEIGLTLFNDPNGAGRGKVLRSPDGNYFAVWSERGRLDFNRVEDSLRFYRSQDVAGFLRQSDDSQPPSPVWIVNRTDKEGPIINDWRWLPDSSGVAFLDGGGDFGDKSLVLADLRKRTVEPLTSTTEVVGSFDVRDREHYVYTASNRVERETLQQKLRTESRAAATTIGTGHSLIELLIPDEERLLQSGLLQSAPSHLWAVISSKRFEVKQDGAPVDPGELALSPDGNSLATTLPVHEVPSSWETLYPPPFASMPYRIRRNEPAHQYVRINLKTGSIQSLTDAPIGRDAGWGGGYTRPSWSSDAQAILLPATFLSSQGHMPSTPCVAVVDLPSMTRTCVATLKGQTDQEGYNYLLVAEALFVRGNKERVIVTTYEKSSYHTAEYRHTSENAWQAVFEPKDQSIKDESEDLEVVVKEGLDQPPLLVAKDKETSRVLWSPNPQLDNIELGHASVYTWKDKEGRQLKGGLYKPFGYKSGQRYPLVIQTYNFWETQFRPSGFLTTGYAARALAAAGTLVLQLAEHCPIDTTSEGSCAVSRYESAVDQLVSEGLVDPERIGIIGFSRSCFWTMEALTASSIHFKAALVTDGFMATYSQYIQTIRGENEVPRQLDSMIGAPPFGEGLQQWLKRSPGFNLDRITAALLVVAEGRSSLLFMWEPYAGLSYLHKPVDLIMLNTGEHVLTNPAVRMASQGGSVDWFRFWLKGEEDYDPAKKEQYARWRKLRKLQEKDEATRAGSKR